MGKPLVMVDEVTVSQHYFRPNRPVSWRLFAVLCAGAALLAPALHAQYPGQITKNPKNTPVLRAVAVLEWTGEAGKPKQCRLVPVSVFDGEALQDGGLYLAKPEPITVSSEVEYQLKENGKTTGLFDIKNAGQEQGSWVGYGDWKSLPKPKSEVAATRKIDDEDDEDDDKPVLHRKHRADDSAGKGSSGSNAPAPSDDPDRPTLHKKTDDSSANSAGTAPIDPDRPVMKEPKPQTQPGPANTEVGHVDSLPTISDPDRPRLVRGRSTAENLHVLPSLMGLPPDMQQAVAVSDATNRPDHPWTFSWANPADELKMKAQLEDIARQAMQPPAPAAAKTTGAHHATARKPSKPEPAAEPAPLEDEQFRVFELAYGSGATMVLTAHTPGPLAQEKFATLIAQPDLYGNVLVLFKSVTDGAHLDETPRMRLIDAVDAEGDNRGELLFELRGDTSRQFALFRVLRGRADKLFVTSGGYYGSAASD